MYEVEFADGEKASLVANYIVENLFAQIDDDGNRQVLMNEIIDYRTNGTELKQKMHSLQPKREPNAGGKPPSVGNC